MPEIPNPNQIPNFDSVVAFSYEYLNEKLSGLKHIVLKDKESNKNLYYASSTNMHVGGDVVWFKFSREIGKVLRPSSGFKLHISLAHYDDNIAKGWNIVKDCLLKYEIELAKVISKQFSPILSRHPSQCGKEITIYMFRERSRKPLDWQPIIQEITKRLQENNVIPGRIPPSDKPINGSNYVNYRNDKLDRAYKVDHSPDLFEPLHPTTTKHSEPDDSPDDDPYKNIRVNVPNQLPRALFLVDQMTIDGNLQNPDSIPSSRDTINITYTASNDSKVDSKSVSEQNLQQSITITERGNSPASFYHSSAPLFQPSTPKSTFTNPIQNPNGDNLTNKCCNIT